MAKGGLVFYMFVEGREAPAIAEVTIGFREAYNSCSFIPK